MIFEKLAELLADYKDLDVKTITPETTFEEMEFDSLDVVDVLMQLDDEFGVEVEMSPDLKTVGDVVKVIEEKQNA
ncbi:MAG: acyl carrier protein [Bacillota bacterium]